MQCPNCETENRDDAKFCDECGFPLGGFGAASAVDTPSTTSSFDDGLDDSWFVASNPNKLSREPKQLDPVVTDEQFDAVFDNAFDDVSEPNAEVAVAESAVDTTAAALEGQNSVALPEEKTPQQADSAAKTIAFNDDAWEQPEVEAFSEGATSVIEDDPFAGFSTQAAESEFDIYDNTPAPENYMGYQAPTSGYTMQMPRVGNEEKPSSKDFRVSSAASKRPSKAVFAIIGVITVAIIAAVITFALGLWGGVAVPDVTGMTEADARALLEENGFSVRSTQVKSDDTEGLVLVMDPAGNTHAAEGSEIVIHIATARFVPDIVGKSYDEAKKLLDEAGYENVRYDKVKSAEAENIVLSVSPEAGTRAKSSMEVVVGVSEAYRVPDISNLSLDAAQQAITKGGLVPQVVYVDTQEYPEGTIIGTTPEANTKVSEGDYVSIKVARARGAELVSLTEQLLAPGNTATVGGTDIAIDSVGTINYVGDDTVSFQITGRPFATLMGETVYGSPQTVEGQVTWSEGNEVLSIS